MRKQRFALAVLVALVLGVGVGCNPVAVVTYRQIGACSGLPNQSLIWFQFVTLDNSSGVTSATFDPYASYIEGHQNDGVGLGFIDLGETGQQAVFRGFPAAMKITVAAGATQTLDEIGIALLQVSLQEATSTPYALVTSGALGDKLNASQTSWPQTSCDGVSIQNAM
jgi:hypothetical protein